MECIILKYATHISEYQDYNISKYIQISVPIHFICCCIMHREYVDFPKLQQCMGQASQHERVVIPFSSLAGIKLFQWYHKYRHVHNHTYLKPPCVKGNRDISLRYTVCSFRVNR